VTTSFLLIAVDALREGVRQISSDTTLEIPGKKELLKHLGRMAMDSDAGSGRGRGQVKDSQEPTGFEEHLVGDPPNEDNTPARQQNPAMENETDGDDGRSGGEPKEKQSLSAQQQVIRVDIEKLDKLLDLVGELVIAEAMVANDQDIRGLNLDRFEKSVLRLDKITREIQEVAMSMRMIPLAGTFRKMMRLVRDLANKADKKVELHVIGEETEVDKTIIEQISDPLVHLIRNAVDHGLESPEERRLTGKPETGRITVEAKHSAGEVWIIVEDDGRGLNRERILSKGVERGLVKGEDRELKDEEVWQLVFEPGFSTSEQVSSISGRGVGMDVVKRNIEKLRGRVDVRSKEGAGSVFAIRIPLTLAIIEGLVVRVGMNRYTIPISSVKESFQPRAEQITSMPDGQEVVKIRGDLLPVIRLHELYRAPQAFGRLTDGILIVVESNQEKYCLFVDELVGQQQIVIKGLSTYFGRVRGVSGCAILGDGDISMILDIDDLIGSVGGAEARS
jgi:two-component system chemotaxis sensor kinase CheA